MKMKISAIAIACAAAFISASASASISVSPPIVNIMAGSKAKYADVKVTNVGKEKSYITVHAERILNPGTPQEKVMVSTGKSPMEFGLGFTPHKFVLAPGQFRSVRMIPTQYPKHKDYVYLLDIHDQGKDSWHPVMSKQKAVSHVSVTETLGVRLLVRPANARAVITMKRQGQQVTFTNKGNTDAYVKLHCPSSSPDCVTPETMSRVYAGTTWSVKLGKTAPVSYEVEYPGFHSSYKLS